MNADLFRRTFIQVGRRGLTTVSQQQQEADTYVRRDDSVEGLLAGLVEGDRYALARAITLGKRKGTPPTKEEHPGRDIDSHETRGRPSTFSYSHALNFPKGFQGTYLADRRNR